MQPHSMVAIMAAHHIWNHGNPKQLKSGQVSVEFTDWTSEPARYYWFTNVRESSDRCQLAMDINHNGSCNITVRRNSTTPGSNFELSHTQQHASGLLEYFRMEKENINGKHINSLKYGEIHADMKYDDRMEFRDEIRDPLNPSRFITIRYTVKIV